MSENQEFEKLLRELWPDLSPQATDRLVRYRESVVRENENQNLTRLTSPVDFYWGHCADVRALHASKLVCFPALDMGSGAGIPGLLSAIVGHGPWVLCESEKRKAEFLKETAKGLGVEGVEIFAGRAEDYLKRSGVQSVVARAVGPVGRIMSWIEKCSTWNNLVLLKGPAWSEEWTEFDRGGRSGLELDGSYEYQVGPEAKKRVIVRLKRVRAAKVRP